MAKKKSKKKSEVKFDDVVVMFMEVDCMLKCLLRSLKQRADPREINDDTMGDLCEEVYFLKRTLKLFDKAEHKLGLMEFEFKD